MYYEAGQWEEAFRIVRLKGTPREAAVLALEWAMSLGPELGSKLLVRNGMLDDCITLACEKELVIQYLHCFNENMLKSGYCSLISLRASLSQLPLKRSRLFNTSSAAICRRQVVGKRQKSLTSRYYTF